MADLFLVFGGPVKDARGRDFVDAASLDVVGLFDDGGAARAAWRGASQRWIDDADMKYVILDLGAPLAGSGRAAISGGSA